MIEFTFYILKIKNFYLNINSRLRSSIFIFSLFPSFLFHLFWLINLFSFFFENLTKYLFSFPRLKDRWPGPISQISPLARNPISPRSVWFKSRLLASKYVLIVHVFIRCSTRAVTQRTYTPIYLQRKIKIKRK